MCGIVGVVSTDQCNQQIYDSLLLLQHRGQDSTGIATMDGSVFHINKSIGQVREAYRTRDMRGLIGKNLGIKVILFFLVLGTIVYLAKNRLWREVH